jgi:hypothetical protein
VAVRGAPSVACGSQAGKDAGDTERDRALCRLTGGQDARAPPQAGKDAGGTAEAGGDAGSTLRLGGDAGGSWRVSRDAGGAWLLMLMRARLLASAWAGFPSRDGRTWGSAKRVSCRDRGRPGPTLSRRRRGCFKGRYPVESGPKPELGREKDPDWEGRGRRPEKKEPPDRGKKQAPESRKKEAPEGGDRKAPDGTKREVPSWGKGEDA